MQAAPDLAVLRRRVVLLAGEVALDGWAATHGVGGVAVLGLLVVTSWRVIFVDLDGGFSAFPTFKIHAAECDACQLSLSVWYDRMQVRFDNPAAARAVLNLLRQDRGWNASELRAAPGGATFPSPPGLVSIRRPRFAPAGLARAS